MLVQALLAVLLLLALGCGRSAVQEQPSLTSTAPAVETPPPTPTKGPPPTPTLSPEELEARYPLAFTMAYLTSAAFILPPEVDICVAAAIGQARFVELRAGSTEPAEEDHQAARLCLAARGIVSVTVGEETPSPTPSPDELEAMYPLGFTTAYLTSAAFILPPEVDICVAGAIGQARFVELRAGSTEPAEEDHQAARLCLAARGIAGAIVGGDEETPTPIP